LVSTHYRSQIEFADSLLEEARTALAKLQNALSSLRQAPVTDSGDVGEEVKGAVEASRKRFGTGMDDDFNTREAVAALFDLANFSNGLLHEKDAIPRSEREALLGAFGELGGVLGLFEKKGQEPDVVEGLVRLLQEVRQEARAKKDFATSDKIRDRLKQMGVIIDSMTRHERRFPDVINGSRKRRIASGSGTQIHDINRLLKQHKQMQKMMKQMRRRGKGIFGFGH
jgi:cysteinyl-tRNA synthetase